MPKCGAETEVYSRVTKRETNMQSCIICGGFFEPKNQIQKTCSPECAKAAFNIRRKEWRHKQYTAREYEIRQCAFCGKDFEVKKWKRKYCSSECSKKAWLQTEEGKAYKKAKDARYNAKPEVKERKNQSFILHWHSDKSLRERMRSRKYALKAFPDAQPCSICGNPISERHHPDYGKPTEIVWLCKKHHEELHSKEAHHAAMQRAM